MNAGISKYAIMAFSMVNMLSDQQDQWKEEILKKWRESTNLPRKKKKKVRKELRLDWSIACWDPFKI